MRFANKQATLGSAVELAETIHFLVIKLRNRVCTFWETAPIATMRCTRCRRYPGVDGKRRGVARGHQYWLVTGTYSAVLTPARACTRTPSVRVALFAERVRCDHSCDMKLVQNRIAIRGVMMTAITIGGLVLSAGAAKAGVIPISFTTTGTFSAGTPSDLSYIPTAFSGVTSATGFLLLPDLGEFTLSETADPMRFNGDTFTLHLNFLMPLGVIGPVDFVASLSGHINANGKGNVHLNFTPNSSAFAFANAAGSGTFTLGVNDVIGLQQNDTATATGSIANAIDPPAAAPEPCSLILFGTGLITLSYTARRRVRK